MTGFQKIVKYLAIAFAIFLIVSIVGGILGAVGIWNMFSGGSAVSDTVKSYQIPSPISSLEITINAADLTVQQADRFLVESNLQDLKVTERNGKLILEEDSGFAASYTGAKLTVYIPSQTVLESVNIKTGAGKLTVDTLIANSVRLELGAGEVRFEQLTAYEKADIEGGAGKITVAGGSLANLDLEMGVGQLNLTSALVGSSELDLGVGETNLTLIGSETAYALDMEKGLGSITVNGEDVSRYSSAKGKNRIDIDGGIGAIRVVFTENQ